MSAVRVSWQVSPDGSPLGKAHSVTASAELVSTPARRYVEGCIIRETAIESLEDLLRDARQLGGTAHRLSGTFEAGMDGQVLHSGGRDPGATKDYLEHRAGPGVMCFDIDKGQRVAWLKHEDVVAGLRAAIPWLRNVRMLVMDSSGSCITLDGAEVRGSGGYHVYVIVESALDIPRLLEDAHRRCFLAGLGRVDVGNAAQFLERSPVDLALRTATQPDFMVPHLASPRLGRSREPTFFDGGRVPAGVELLSPAEVERYRQIVAEYKKEKAPEREAKLAECADRRGRAAYAKHGGNLADHIATARSAYESQTLPADFVLMLSDGGTCTVGELIANPELAGTGWCLPDPLEPDCGPNKAKLFRDRAPMVIRSHVHGGRDYQLDARRPGDRSRVPGEDDDDDPPLDLTETLARLRAEANQRPITREFWRPLLFEANLEATDVEQFLKALFELKVGGKQALRSEWTKYRDEHSEAERAQADQARGMQSASPARPVANGEADASPGALRFIEGDYGPKAILENIIRALRQPGWDGLIVFDELGLRPVLLSPTPAHRSRSRTGQYPHAWDDADDAIVAAWLQAEYGLYVKPNQLQAAVRVASTLHPVHAVRDYLNGLHWDSQPRLDKWLHRYLGAPDTPLSRAFGSKFLISAVARVRQPGIKVDHMLILEGKQGALKSTGLEKLMPSSDLFTDDLGESLGKDAAERIAGKWLVEVAELDALSRSEVTRIKSFITRQVDRFRPAYGRWASDSPRQCVFAGTTNADAYLKDETGGRRFWPVRIGTIDLAALQGDRDQLWAEANARHAAGEHWWLEDPTLVAEAGAAQRTRFVEDVWQLRIEEILAGREAVTITQILDCLGVEVARQGQAEQNRVAKTLKVLGWARVQVRREGTRAWVYRPSPVSPVLNPDQNIIGEGTGHMGNDEVDAPQGSGSRDAPGLVTGDSGDSEEAA